VEGAAEQAARADHQHKRDVRCYSAGTEVSTRNALNFIAGSNVVLSLVDDAVNDRIDINISATAATSVGLRTIWIPATAMVARTTSGAAIGTAETATNKVMVRTLDFDKDTAEYAQFTVRMPKSWDESLLQAQFVWSHATATDSTSASTGVTWAIMATAFSSGETLDATFSGTATVAKIGREANYVWISDATASFAVADSPSAQDFVVFQVSRVAGDGADTFGNDARLHGVTLLYKTDAGTDD
jgi:hypothetical protein